MMRKCSRGEDIIQKIMMEKMVLIRCERKLEVLSFASFAGDKKGWVS